MMLPIARRVTAKLVSWGEPVIEHKREYDDDGNLIKVNGVEISVTEFEIPTGLCNL